MSYLSIQKYQKLLPKVWLNSNSHPVSTLRALKSLDSSKESICLFTSNCQTKETKAYSPKNYLNDLHKYLKSLNKKANIILLPQCPTFPTILTTTRTYLWTKVALLSVLRSPAAATYSVWGWTCGVEVEEIEIGGRSCNWNYFEEVEDLGWDCCFPHCHRECAQKIEGWGRDCCWDFFEKIQNWSWASRFSGSNIKRTKTFKSECRNWGWVSLKEIKGWSRVSFFPSEGTRRKQENQSGGGCEADSD